MDGLSEALCSLDDVDRSLWVFPSRLQTGSSWSFPEDSRLAQVGISRKTPDCKTGSSKRGITAAQVMCVPFSFCVVL